MKALKKDPVKKIFVGGLNRDTSNEALQEYFIDFVKIETVELSQDSKAEKRKDLYLLHTKEKASVKKVMEKKNQTINGSKGEI